MGFGEAFVKLKTIDDLDCDHVIATIRRRSWPIDRGICFMHTIDRDNKIGTVLANVADNHVTEIDSVAAEDLLADDWMLVVEKDE